MGEGGLLIVGSNRIPLLGMVARPLHGIVGGLPSRIIQEFLVGVIGCLIGVAPVGSLGGFLAAIKGVTDSFTG